MGLKLRRLSNPNRINEWVKIAKLSKPNSIKEMRREVRTAIENKSIDLNLGVPFYFEFEGKIIGTSYIKQTEYDTSRSNGLSIFHVAIAKKYQGKNYGQRMLLEVFKEIKKYKKDFALLFTIKAKGFYEKCGMTQWGNIPGFVRGKTRYFLYKKL